MIELYKRVTIDIPTSQFYGNSYFHRLVRREDGKLYWKCDIQLMINNERPQHFTQLDPKGRDTRADFIPFLEGDL